MAKIHTLRPEKLRKGKSWMCKCQVINLYEAVQCKMIQVEAHRLKEKQRAALSKNLIENGSESEKLRVEMREHIDKLISEGK